MSFLSPLYIAGLLAIGLPILFHLIRRTPQKRQVFSSLMFLSPSPPRLTRRSRLTNILLLLLRAAALALLAFAFARPFFYRHNDLTVSQSQGRRMALLVDTSASMRRGDLWEQAKKQVESATNDLSPSDEVSLFFFDRTVRPAFTLSEWNELEFSRRLPLLKARLGEASPTWAGTNLGEALSTVADQLAEARAADKSADTTRRQVVLISDLQQGSHPAALQGHEWPENVLLDVKPVALKQTANACLQLIKPDKDAPAAEVGKIRVRISNQAGSTSDKNPGGQSSGDQFTLTWANAKGPAKSIEPQKIYVAPGQSQIVHLTMPPANLPADQQADRLVLSGDQTDFDNTLFIAAARADTGRIIYLGDDLPDDAAGPNYYLRSALADTAQRTIEFVQRKATDPLGEADVLDARLVVITTAMPDDRIPILRRFLEAGGGVLWMLKDAGSAQGLASLMQADGLEVKESASRDFVLISRVELEHPLFAAFADARFADFTKIHFWKHRAVKFPDSAAAHVVASFDTGDPFLFETSIGKGQLRVMTSGWQPADSQFALSTKFVPLMNGFLQKREVGPSQADFAVGDAIPLPESSAANRSITSPDGKKTDLPASAKSFDATTVPGVYHLADQDQQISLAVNLAADESRTSPLIPADLEQWGAKPGDKAPPELLVAKQRELKFFELENRQKMWRWLILVVLGLVAAETVVAGKIARGRTQVPSVTA